MCNLQALPEPLKTSAVKMQNSTIYVYVVIIHNFYTWYSSLFISACEWL